MTEWKSHEGAPTDGSLILIDAGGYVLSAKFHRWTKEEREGLPLDEQDTEGYWEYADEDMQEIDPGGIGTPFRWCEHPDMNA